MKLLLTVLVTVFTLAATAQKKYALLIGIDNYFKQINSLSDISLKGCVNDAITIRTILENRFSFKPQEIDMLVNEQASKANIIQAFNKLISNASAGDVVFIYYAGHGVSLINSYSRDDKKNEGILASDLYSPTSSIIYDNDIKTFVHKLIAKKAIATLIYDCCYSGGLARAVPDSYLEFNDEGAVRTVSNYELENEGVVLSEKPLDNLITDDEQRSMTELGTDLKSKEYVSRPEDVPNSQFLYIAAATNRQESKERLDLNNIKHGAFTTALMEVLKKAPANTPTNMLFKKIEQELKIQMVPSQDPMMYGDVNRQNRNLLGASWIQLSNSELTVVKKDAVSVYLSPGAALGINVGNVLQGTETSAQVFLKVKKLNGNNEVVATILRGSLSGVTKGSLFTISDWTTISQPRLKVYLPSSAPTLKSFNTYVQQIALPSANDGWLVDYNIPQSHTFLPRVYYTKGSWYLNREETFLIPIETLKISKLKRLTQFPFYMYLPWPAELIVAVKSKLRANQNIEIVSDPTKADLGFYAMLNKDNQMVFVSSNELMENKLSDKHRIGYRSYTFEGALLTPKDLTSIATNIVNNLMELASKKGWLNFTPSKN